MLLEQQHALIEGLQTQVGLLEEQVQVLQERLNKDSHNSHLPPSSDRFHRQPKGLRKPSGKRPGGQTGHAGKTLLLSPTPDQVIVHTVEQCQHCQRDLRKVESLQIEATRCWICHPDAWW
jgi:transposase